jgi:ADP-ribose pyrophosphatase
MKILSSEEKYKSKIFTVAEEHAVDSDGFELKRGIVLHAGSAVMMVVDENKQILLVRQFRLPARQSLWELPAGRLDEGESPLKAAKRELKEETGYSAKKWDKLATFYPSPGYVSEKMTVFLATDLTQGEQHLMDDERIETRWFSHKEVRDLIDSGKIMDGKTIIGYYRWRALSKRA